EPPRADAGRAVFGAAVSPRNRIDAFEMVGNPKGPRPGEVHDSNDPETARQSRRLVEAGAGPRDRSGSVPATIEVAELVRVRTRRPKSHEFGYFTRFRSECPNSDEFGYYRLFAYVRPRCPTIARFTSSGSIAPVLR